MIQATQILVGASVQLVWAQADDIGFMQVSEYYFSYFCCQANENLICLSLLCHCLSKCELVTEPDKDILLNLLDLQ